MLIHPQIDPIAFSIGPLAVRWYGLMYLAGFGAAWWLGQRRIKAGFAPITRQQFDDLIFLAVLGVILGGRLGYVLFYKSAEYFAEPWRMLYVWEGGMSFHGGLIGVILAMAWFARSRRQDWLAVTDFIAPLAPLALAAGRLGNFINAELWGRPATVPWAMVFPNVDGVPRHPSQLYEFALEGVVLFAVLWWFSARPRPRGAVSASFLVGYGLLRFGVEYTREPDRFLGLLSLGFSMGQWLSLPMVLAGVGLMTWAYRAKNVNRDS
jgi:phosphatidylglycerol---prolipoprotein diacylglyceryl transferase